MDTYIRSKGRRVDPSPQRARGITSAFLKYLLTALIAFLPGVTWAFTIGEHEEITVRQTSTVERTWLENAVLAPDLIEHLDPIRYPGVNARYLQTRHFDNGSFLASLDAIGRLDPTSYVGSTEAWRRVQIAVHVYDALVSNLGPGTGVNLFRSQQPLAQLTVNLGLILNAHQDFYAHSNYVEQILFSNNLEQRIANQSSQPSVPLAPGGIPLWRCLDATVFCAEIQNGMAPITYNRADNGQQVNKNLTILTGSQVGGPSVLPDFLVSGKYPEATVCPAGFGYFQETGLCAILRVSQDLTTTLVVTPPAHDALRDDLAQTPAGLAKDGCAVDGTIAGLHITAGCKPQGLFVHSGAQPGLTLFDYAKDLALRQTARDLTLFRSLRGSMTGEELLDDLASRPELLQWLDDYFDPNNPDFATNYLSAMSLDLQLEDFPDLFAPVPEPEPYAMMLAGLGYLALVTRRKKQQTT